MKKGKVNENDKIETRKPYEEKVVLGNIIKENI